MGCDSEFKNRSPTAPSQTSWSCATCWGSRPPLLRLTATAARSQVMSAGSPVINPLSLCLSEEQLEEDKLHSNEGKVSPVLAAHLQNLVAVFLIQSLFFTLAPLVARGCDSGLGFLIPAFFTRSSIHVWSFPHQHICTAPLTPSCQITAGASSSSPVNCLPAAV